MCNYEKIAWYAGEIYGKVKMTQTKDKSLLFITTPWDEFKICLNDMPRFGYYTIYHHNKYKDGWHRQKKCSSLNFAVFTCVIHGFYKEYDLYAEFGDCEKFTKDAIRAWKFENDRK